MLLFSLEINLGENCTLEKKEQMSTTKPYLSQITTLILQNSSRPKAKYLTLV